MDALKRFLHPHVSLAARAAIVVAKNCWYHLDINRLVKDYPTIVWHLEEMKVVDNLMEMKLPEASQRLLSFVVHEVGNQLENWIIFHNFLDVEVKKISFTEALSWSCLGVIDYNVTAQRILKNKSIHVLARFTLACSSIFENRFAEQEALWIELLSYEKGSCRMKVIHAYHGHISHSGMINYLTLMAASRFLGFREDFIRLNLSSQYANVLFRHSLENNDFSQIESMLKDVMEADPEDPDEEKLIIDPINVALMLDSLPDDQRKPCSILLLNNCLDFPLCFAYMSVAREIAPLLTVANLEEALSGFQTKSEMLEKPDYYHELFVDFWGVVPILAKKAYIGSVIIGDILTRLFQVGAVEDCLKRLLVDVADKETLEAYLASDAKALLTMLMTHNKHKAFRHLLTNCLGPQKLVSDFHDVYEELCDPYLKKYYGELVEDEDVDDHDEPMDYL